MTESYVTLSEAAELEGVPYSTMARRTQRNKGIFVTKTEKSEMGGRDVVLVAVSSLSKQARNAWKEREKLKSLTEGLPEQDGGKGPERPWYVDVDADCGGFNLLWAWASGYLAGTSAAKMLAE